MMEVTIIFCFIFIIGYIGYWVGINSKSQGKLIKPIHINGPLNSGKDIDIESIHLANEQKELFNLIEETSESMFITGKAGSGKSVLLRYFVAKTRKKVVVSAFTGIAALNVNGVTLNSLFRLPYGVIDDPDKARIPSSSYRLFRELDTLIIDEISMVRVDYVNTIDAILRKIRSNDQPFGGVQLIAFGDVYQLPPVVPSDEPGASQYFDHNFGGAYFFNSPAWKKLNPKIYELQQNHRQGHADDQQEKEWVRTLDRIRVGEIDIDLIDKLNERYVQSEPTGDIITISTNNAKVASINARKLTQLIGTSYFYTAAIFGKFDKSSFPTEEVLELKVGALVVMLKNDLQKRWVNGMVARIHSLTKDMVSIIIDKIPHQINRVSWEKNEYDYDPDTRTIVQQTVASFNQFPVRLAWAMTIHKSQGQTYNAVSIDMDSGAFAHGQTYVALSRCRRLNTTFLLEKVRLNDFILDTNVKQFMHQKHNLVL